MKNVFQLSCLLFVLLLALPASTQAQDSDVDKYFDESQGFTHRLWYGGGLGLGFSGVQGSSLFRVGISPLIGYKLTENLSVGPRFSLQYSHYRENFIGFVARANLIDYGAGVFTRYKLIRDFFIHLEYGADLQERVNLGTINGNEFATSRVSISNGYVGVGYNASFNGVWGTDLYLLYNVLLPENSLRSPFDLRFGITYNF